MSPKSYITYYTKNLYKMIFLFLIVIRFIVETLVNNK